MNEREHLPPVRKGCRYEGNLGKTKFYLTLNYFPDGRLGEMFVDLAREGAELRTMYHQLSMLVSRLLQYGLPAENLVRWWKGVRSEISGFMNGCGIAELDNKSYSSLFDMFAAIIEHEAIGEDAREANSGGVSGQIRTCPEEETEEAAEAA